MYFVLTSLKTCEKFRLVLQVGVGSAVSASLARQIENAVDWPDRVEGAGVAALERHLARPVVVDPSIKECDIWNIEATFLDPLPDDAMRITVDPGEIGVNQLEVARKDSTRTAITIRTQRKSRLQPGEVIHLGFE